MGDFNATVGKSNDVDDVIGILGESTCNSNVYLWIVLLQRYNVMNSNGRTLFSDHQQKKCKNLKWRKYLISDKAIIESLSNAFMDRTDIGSSAHYLVWFELG